MFKKKCNRCGKRTNKSFEFCPFCGTGLKSKFDQDDYGFLGKNDIANEPLPSGGSFIDRMFNNALKMLEKQMRNLPKDFHNPDRFPNMPNNLKVQFFVDGKRVLPENVNKKFKHPRARRVKPVLSDEKKQKFAKLPKKEPPSKVRRLGGKVVYELEIPGVKALEDILINQLENSIEIKALSNDKVYYKTLNINLPILRYQLNKGNLILELKTDRG
jgi:HSP20 family molecular chaperone IbpA